MAKRRSDCRVMTCLHVREMQRLTCIMKHLEELDDEHYPATLSGALRYCVDTTATVVAEYKCGEGRFSE